MKLRFWTCSCQKRSSPLKCPRSIDRDILNSTSFTGDMTRERVRKKRDPQRKREAILEAAREVLAQDGKEGLSVAQVTQRAGVNRGTAYQHFQTREQLLEATAAWVSDKLYRAVFGDPIVARDQPVETISVEGVNEHLAQFAMENPELGRVWLFEVLSSSRPANDPFWRQYGD
jgi:AcrR family transcriptional regulator